MAKDHPKIFVIGGGVIGLSCAWRLAEAGARVALFDARASGEGATLGALGALWPASPLAKGPLQQLHRASLWQFEEFIGELSRRTGVPVGFARLGRLELLNSAHAVARAGDEALAACAEWPAFGKPAPLMEVLEPARIATCWPQLAPATHGGLHCRVTAQVKVAELVKALRAACVQAGVTIWEQTPVLGLEQHNGRITGVRTGGGVEPTDGVLAAAGAWSTLLGAEVGKVAPVRPVKGQGLALLMPAGMRLEMIVKAELIYLIPWHSERQGEILVGSTTEVEAGFDEKPTEAVRRYLLASAAAIVPGLKEAVVLRHWTGLRPQNPAKRHPPIMGRHPEVTNLYICTGHYKTGIGLAPLVSHMMERMIIGEESPELLAPFAPRAGDPGHRG